MKNLAKIVLVFSFVLFGTYSHGQILDKLGKKMERKIEERANRKIDKAMDKTLDKAEEEIDESVQKKPKEDGNGSSKSSEEEIDKVFENQSNQQNPGGLFGALGGKVDIEDSYSFDVSLQYQMTSISKKETNVINYNFSMPENGGEYMMMELVGLSQDGKPQEVKEAVHIIFDNKNKAMVMVMEEQKMVMPMSMDIEDYIQEENEEAFAAHEDYKITKTGKTKSIAGYSCEEYTVLTEQGSGNMWITNDSRLRHFDPFTSMASNSKGAKNGPVFDIKGAVMEMNMTMTDTKKGSDPHTIKTEVLKVTTSRFTKNLSGYTNPMDYQK